MCGSSQYFWLNSEFVDFHIERIDFSACLGFLDGRNLKYMI